MTDKVRDVYACSVAREVSRHTSREVHELKTMVTTLVDAVTELIATLGTWRSGGRSHKKCARVIARQDPHRFRRFAGTTVNTELKRLIVLPDHLWV